MKTIINTKIFDELQAAHREEQNLWEVLFDWEDDPPSIRDRNIPVLAGGLDNVEVTRGGIYYYDIGNNGLDNSFVIRPEL